MSDPIGDRAKITATHLARLAFVYVRQSSGQQVRCNRESQRRQYDFAAQAEQWGWSRDRIVIIDEDQGRSGAIPYARSGFGRVVSVAARGEGGIVMSLELSRLARNDPDWHHLVYLCRWTETLIADEHGIFDPAASADRMVLGIRGQVSELERDNAVHRMVEARWSKARRGEAFTIPPAGYNLDERGQLVPTADAAVRAALARVFQQFDALGAARQVYLWWREAGLPFPVRRLARRAHPRRLGARLVPADPADAAPPDLRRRVCVRPQRDPAGARPGQPAPGGPAGEAEGVAGVDQGPPSRLHLVRAVPAEPGTDPRQRGDEPTHR
jgi:DNA invertase Pin-like site-specific DNA recombinase